MHVRKFQGASIKDVIKEIKDTLGPEAIIIRSRDLLDEYGQKNGVEITTAVTDSAMKKKEFIEKEIPKGYLNKYKQSSSKSQKAFIERYIEKASSNKKSEEDQSRHVFSQTPYASIKDEPLSSVTNPIRRSNHRSAKSSNSRELQSLREEVDYLRKMIAKNSRDGRNMLEDSLQDKVSKLYPGAEYGLPYDLSRFFENFLKTGISEDVTVEVLREVNKKLSLEQRSNSGFVQAYLARYILKSTHVCANPWMSRVHAFLGPAGAGKTTQTLKAAAKLIKGGQKRVAIVTTDTFKIGAVDQMKVYAQILNVPLAVIREQREWENLLKDYSHIDYFLCDFPSLSWDKESDKNKAINLLPPRKRFPVQVHFVLSSLYQSEHVFDIAKRIQRVKIDDVIFTFLDQAYHHGIIYCFQRKMRIPLHSFGTGPQILEDYEMASREKVLDLLFHLSKTNMSHVQEGGI